MTFLRAPRTTAPDHRCAPPRTLHPDDRPPLLAVEGAHYGVCAPSLIGALWACDRDGCEQVFEAFPAGSYAGVWYRLRRRRARRARATLGEWRP